MEDDGKRAFRLMDVVIHGVKPMGGGLEGGALCNQDLTRPPELLGCVYMRVYACICVYVRV